jgi:hypothetical protein
MHTIDIENAREEIARISALGRAAFGSKWHFATLTLWGPDHRQRGAAISITLHIHNGSHSAPGRDAAEAFEQAEKYIRAHDPAAREAEGWATLGAQVAP